MGSSSSSQKAPLKSHPSKEWASFPNNDTLVGSSTPPKGPPKAIARNGASTTNDTTTTTDNKRVSIADNKNQKGTKDVKEGNRDNSTTKSNEPVSKTAKHVSIAADPKDKPGSKDVKSDAAAEEGKSKSDNSDDKSGRQSRAHSARRLKSAQMRPETRKSIVRKMEKGMEDEDNVDDILGLTRMKTKTELKRERTRVRIEGTDPDDPRRKSLAMFQKAGKQVQHLRETLPTGSQADIFMGNVNIECPPRAKIVRIFTSSTFTDTMHERNTLMKDGYPRVKAFCQELGYDFQVVDMRWGIRDQASNDNTTTEICLRELNMCQKLSTGPNFVMLQSHKYGYTDFPRCINADEFETIIAKVTDQELVGLFQKWYKKDLNARPPAYVVCPISAHLPDFLSADRAKKDAAKKQWWVESEKLQAALEDIAARVFDAATARKYIRSVSETEIQMGLLEAKEPAKQCLWLRRTIADLDKQESSYLLSRYTESTFNNSAEKVEKSQQMLTELQENRVKPTLPPENILAYSVKWNKDKGIDPEKDKAHAAYLSAMSKDFVSAMCRRIREAVEAKSQSEDRLVEEIVQHVQFCQDRCRAFHGRHDLIKRAGEYLLGMSNEPLVLHGDSGSGKTSVMARLAEKAWTWMQKKATIVIRFIGTTPASSNLHGLVASITSQIRRSYGIAGKVSEDLRTLLDEFDSCLQLATTDHPLVLILDSLDMLDPSHNARQLQWLPTRLRANVKIIVSTLPGEQYEAFPVLQSTVRTKENIIGIPRIPDSDASDIVDAYLALKDRTLTDKQKSVVLQAFSRCPLPLFLKLSVDKASSWASYTPLDQTVLEATIRASIDNLFQRLEKVHGHIFVSRALGYLSTARVGLTETELEDVLSCDDDVLNDVYMYWTPPIRRLPPLLLVRLKTDLSQYLVERGADGMRVMFWYHRQFLEAAQHRYCSDVTARQALHVALADFFAGTWADGREKPFANPKGDKSGKEDRHVSSQPNKYGGAAYNLRKLNNLPYHRTSAKQLDKLKDECLCNFEFLQDKLTATSLWQIMDDLALALACFHADELLTCVRDVLQLSQNGLLYEPSQLATQLIGRLPQSKTTEKFLSQCYGYPAPSLLADKQILSRPGGQLLHCMAGHKGDILSLDLSADSKMALTCSDDSSVRLWNTRSGKQIRVLDGLGKVSRAAFCNHDNHVYIVMNHKHSVRAATSGEKLFDITGVTDDSPSCTTGEGKTRLVVFKLTTAMVYSAVDGTLTTKVELGVDSPAKFEYPGFAVGSKKYAAVTTEDQIYATVLDTVNFRFTPLFRGFEPFVDKDIDDEIQYEIDEMTLTADEKYLVYSNVYTNDVVFLDFQSKKKTQVIKGNPNDYLRSLQCSRDNKHLYLVKGAFVNVVDMKTKKTSEELEHPVDVVYVCTSDMKTVVTAGEDSNVRVWDRTRKAQSISQNPGVAAYKIRMMTIHENPRYLVGFGFKNKDGDSQFLFVYDLVKNCTVRERLLDCSLLQCELLSATELLVLHDVVRRLCIIDINTMKVTRVFQGYLPNDNWAFKLIRSRKELACLSFGRRNVKIYDVTSGKCAAVLQCDRRDKLDGVVVNEGGTILVTWYEADGERSGPILVFDLVRRKLLRTLKPKGLYITEGEIALSPDGKLLLFKVEDIPPWNKNSQDMDEDVYLEVWDVQKGSRVSSLVDMEYYLRYQSSKDTSGLSSGVDVFEILDNRKVLTAHDDYIMRVFDMTNGAILHRLHGHRTGIEIVNKRESPLVATYGSWTEENSIRVWNKQDFTSVATYTLDKTITQLNWSADGQFLLATTGKPAEIVTWKFNNYSPGVAAKTNTTETLQGQDLQGYLDLVPEDESLTQDPSDPDKDVPSDDSDYDDDDPI